MDGTLERAGERWHVRFTRHLPYSPETVWRAITEPVHLAAWFPQRIVGPWIAGTPLQFVSQYGYFDGEVIAVRRPALLEFRWGTDGLRFEIVPEADGCTLTLLDTLDQYGTAARTAAGWHECLDNLEEHLAGRTPPWQPGDRWHAVHPRYVEAFGAEAATMGPPAAWEEQHPAR